MAVSAAAASSSPPFLASLTGAQRTVLEQVVRRIWHASVEAAAHWQESDGDNRPRRSRAPVSAIQLPSHTRSSSSASSSEEEETEQSAHAAGGARSAQHTTEDNDRRGSRPSLSPQALGDDSRKRGCSGPGGEGVRSGADAAQEGKAAKGAAAGDLSSAADADAEKETGANGGGQDWGGAQTLATDGVQWGHGSGQQRAAAERGFAFDAFPPKVRAALSGEARAWV